jgi:DUF1680 family protein
VIEMALVELYRETGEPSYLDLALQLVDVRGHRVLESRGHFDSRYYQDATPVRDETTVVGHAVRALYLLSGVVDLYLETGDRALLSSALRQWESVTATKTYLNGAVGSRFDGESFGDEYELPPDLVHRETCATVAGLMLSWRLLLATGESRFADAMERALYNLFAASTSVERNAFFYNNPAQRRVARPAVPIDTRPQRARGARHPARLVRGSSSRSGGAERYLFAFHFAARSRRSSADGSSRCVPSDQRCPNGSASCAYRSPQNASFGGMSPCAPAAIAVA